MKTYDQYHPNTQHETPCPDTCREATRQCVALFGLPMRLRGGLTVRLDDGEYGVRHPVGVDILTEDELHAHLFGPMSGAVRLIVRDRRIEVFGCSQGREWEVT